MEPELRPPSPRRTVRLRLTALYGSVFLASTAALLTIAYIVARHTLHTRRPNRRALERLGLHPYYEFGFRPGTKNARLVHTLSLSIINGALGRLLVLFIIAFIVISLLTVLIGWWTAGRALRPLRQITAAARRVSGENLGERIDLRGPDDELTQLARTFDGMLERLDAAFASQRHFVANASHELRTPLAVMRTEIDVALGDPAASAAELRTMGEAVREMVDRCEGLIASLLLLARSEASSGQAQAVELSALIADTVTDLRARAAEAEVEVDSALEPAWVSGDAPLLERLLANLLDNGIRHNVPGGRLAVASASDGETVEIRVRNGGPVIEADEVQTLVEPFRRLHRSVEGFGLGLSIVRSIAHAHGGEAQLRAPRTGGLEVRVTLPALIVEEPAPRPTALRGGRPGSRSAGRPAV